MADIQHKNIADPNIHEPKGAAYAAVGTAYVSNGSGSGTWQKVRLASDTLVIPSGFYSGSHSQGGVNLGTQIFVPLIFTGPTHNWGTTNNISIATPNRITITATGTYLASIQYFGRGTASGQDKMRLTPSLSASALSTLHAEYMPTLEINGNDGQWAYSNFVTCVLRFTANSYFGLWADASACSVNRVQNFDFGMHATLTRLGD